MRDTPVILLRTGKITLKVRMEVSLGGVSGTIGKGIKELLITGLKTVFCFLISVLN